jgi:hypothetical protein
MITTPNTERRLRARLKMPYMAVSTVIRRAGRINIRSELASATVGYGALRSGLISGF